MVFFCPYLKVVWWVEFRREDWKVSKIFQACILKEEVILLALPLQITTNKKRAVRKYS